MRSPSPSRHCAPVDRHGVAGQGEQYAGWRAIAGRASPFADAAAARAWLISLIGDSPGARQADPRHLLKIAARLTHPDVRDGDRDLWDRYEAARQLLEKL